jgi:hypothetical protein
MIFSRGEALLDRRGKIKKTSDKAPPTKSLAEKVPVKRAPSKKNSATTSKVILKRKALSKGKEKMPTALRKPMLKPVAEAVPEDEVAVASGQN